MTLNLDSTWSARMPRRVSEDESQWPGPLERVVNGPGPAGVRVCFRLGGSLASGAPSTWLHPERQMYSAPRD